jgi:hypothetical protein
MPKRVRSHELETLSRSYLHKLFEEHNCVVWDLHPDYGEDLLVRIFIESLATQYSFFVQAKATDHIDRYFHRDEKHLSFPIASDHLEHWNRFWEPVILTVWDSKTAITYWQVIQNYIEDEHISLLNRNNINVKIPLSNILDENGIREIFYCTKQRFERFERINEAMLILRGFLEKQLDVRTLYQPGGYYLFIQNGHSDVEPFFLGEMGKEVELFLQEKKISKEQFLKEELFGHFFFGYYWRKMLTDGSVYEEHTKSGGVNLLYRKEGTIFCEFKTVEDWNRFKSLLNTWTYP